MGCEIRGWSFLKFWFFYAGVYCTPTFLELPLTSHLPLIQRWSNQSITEFQIKKCSTTLKALRVKCPYHLSDPQSLSKLSHPSLLHFSNSAKRILNFIPFLGALHIALNAKEEIVLYLLPLLPIIMQAFVSEQSLSNQSKSLGNCFTA